MKGLGPVLREVVRVIEGAVESWPKTTRLATLFLAGGVAIALVVAATTIQS